MKIVQETPKGLLGHCPPDKSDQTIEERWIITCIEAFSALKQYFAFPVKGKNIVGPFTSDLFLS